MGGFRKFCNVIFFLALLVCVGIFACAWFDVEPIATFAEDNQNQPWFTILLLACLVIIAIGALIILFSTVFSRSKHSYQQSSTDFGKINISKAAIRHVVDQIVYEHPEFKGIKTFVYIENGHKPSLQVDVRIAPRGLVSVDEAGETLQKEIKEALEKLTGVPVQSVTLDVRENKDLSDVMTEEETEGEEESEEASDEAETDSDEPAEESEETQADSEEPEEGSGETPTDSEDGDADSEDTSEEESELVDGHTPEELEAASDEERELPEADANESQTDDSLSENHQEEDSSSTANATDTASDKRGASSKEEA